MKKLRPDSIELMVMTILYAILTIYAFSSEHPRALMMLALTLVMAFVTFASRYRNRKSIRTLKGRGHRKSTHTA